jgi:hypothetical protein
MWLFNTARRKAQQRLSYSRRSLGDRMRNRGDSNELALFGVALPAGSRIPEPEHFPDLSNGTLVRPPASPAWRSSAQRREASGRLAGRGLLPTIARGAQQRESPEWLSSCGSCFWLPTIAPVDSERQSAQLRLSFRLAQRPILLPTSRICSRHALAVRLGIPGQGSRNHGS